MSIDPQLKRKQDEWAESLGKCELESYEDRGDAVLAQVSDKFQLGAYWLMDAIAAKSVDFPQNDKEFRYYKISRSSTLRLVYNLACIAQIILPFFAASGCELTAGIKKLSKFIIVDVICLLIYLFDLAMSFWVDPANKRMKNKPWSAFRMFCCFLLFLECIAFSSPNFAGVRVVRCVFPLFLISRRINLQKILQGLLSSGLKSLTVVTALFCVIILWSFIGYLVFRGMQPEDGGLQRYSTFFDAAFATLHCFTSRPFCLIAMKPYFEINQVAAVFFVTLTIAADIICIGLIVAIGSSEYKLFAADYVKKRLKSRASTTRLVFDAFCNKDKQMDKHVWCKLCSSMEGSLYRSKGEAAIIFELEDPTHAGFIGYVSYIRLCALISQRVVVMVPDGLDCLGLNPDQGGEDSQRNSLIVPAVGEVCIAEASEETEAPRRVESRMRHSTSHRTSSTSSNVLVSKKYRQYRLSSVFGSSLWLRDVSEIAGNFCFVILSAYVSVRLWKDQVWMITVRDLVVALLYLLLIVYLLEISSANCLRGWFAFGFMLEAFFWLDMLLRICAFGWAEFSIKVMNKVTVVLNFSSLVAMIVLSQHRFTAVAKSGPLLATIIIQSLRMFSPFFAINSVAVFERILPVLIRAGFIYFSFIYFYAIFAHNFFCGDLNTTLASEGDDDSTSWVNFASLLNFDTYLQSVFTMFEMSILANWSIVMDAAAKKAKTRAYVFFYSFRLMVTLNVLPLLLGFVMQAFVAARKDFALQKKAEADAFVREKESKLPALPAIEAALSSGIVEPPEGLRLTTFRQSSGGQLSDAERNYVPPPVAGEDVSPSKASDRKKYFQPELSLSTQKRVDTAPQYAISGNRAHSSTRLSLWNADLAQSAVSATSSSSASLRESLVVASEKEKDVVIRDLQEQLHAAVQELTRLKRDGGHENRE